MPITIGNNLAKLTALKALRGSSEELSRTSERLSSGLRINRASDDAAGLAVATSLNAQSRIYAQSVRNINDYVSALQIAGSAASEISNSLTRLVELSEQAANGALSGSQRSAMNQEALALRREVNRIISTTRFNGIALLDGTFVNSTAQVGDARAINGISVSLQNVLGTLKPDGTIADAALFGSGMATTSAVVSGDFNGDGFADLAVSGTGGTGIRFLLGNGDGTFRMGDTQLATGSSLSIKLGVTDLNGDGFDDLVSVRNNSSGGGVLGAEVLISNGDGTFRYGGNFDLDYVEGRTVTFGDINGDGRSDMIVASQSDASYTVFIGNGNGTFSAGTSYSSGNLRNITLFDVNRDGRLDIVGAGSSGALWVLAGVGDGTFGTGVSYASTGGVNRDISLGDINGDGIIDAVAPNDEGFAVWFGNSDGSFSTSQTISGIGDAQEISLGDFNDDGVLDIALMTTTSVQLWLNNGDGTFSRASSRAGGNASGGAFGDFNEDGILDLVGGDTGSANLRLYLGRGTPGIAPLDLTSQSEARAALDRLRRTVDSLGVGMGTIGAYQSRLGYAKNVLETTRENYLAAQGRIEDIDVAEETARFVRLQILQQFSVAMLAQANFTSDLVKKLLYSEE